MTQNPSIPPRTPSGSTVETLPEHLAGQAGMPRTEGVAHDLHDISERATAQGREANARLQQGLHETADDASARASTLRDQAADTASDLRDRAADTASDIRERVAGTASDLRDRASETIRSARGRASDTYGDARAWAEDRYETQRQRAAELADRGARRLHEGRTATEQFVSENPLLVGVVGLAAGLLLGALLPRTRQEDQALGPYANDLRDQGIRYARDLTHRGRAFVETALDPENLDAAVQRATAPAPGQDAPHRDAGPRNEAERAAHRL